MVSETLRPGSGLSGFPLGEIPLCAALAGFIVKSRRILKREKELARKCPGQKEVRGKAQEETGPMIQSCKEALRSSEVVASAPRSHTLC